MGVAGDIIERSGLGKQKETKHHLKGAFTTLIEHAVETVLVLPDFKKSQKFRFLCEISWLFMLGTNWYFKIILCGPNELVWGTDLSQGWPICSL